MALSVWRQQVSLGGAGRGGRKENKWGLKRNWYREEVLFRFDLVYNERNLREEPPADEG